MLDLKRPVVLAGAPLESARAAAVMIHGRGASPHDILTYLPTLDQPDFVYLAPDAPDSAWYPGPFSAPLEDNEPYLSASLSLVEEIVDYLNEAGFPARKIMLFGFSQGACLALEYAARNRARYGAVVGLSGGLIGPDGLKRSDDGTLDGSPVFLGCSDVDPYIPRYRVEDSAKALQAMGGAVTIRLYPGLEHIVNEDELLIVRGIMAEIKRVG